MYDDPRVSLCSSIHTCPAAGKVRQQGEEEQEEEGLEEVVDEYLEEEEKAYR